MIVDDTVLSESPETSEDATFAELLAAHDTESATQPLRQGERVRVKIVHIGDDAVFVATGSKVDGVVDRKELETSEGTLPCAVGDYLDLYVVAISSNEITLSKAISGIGGVSALEEARDAGVPVEGKVLGLCKGGFSVEILKRRAFCPASQMDLHPGVDPESHTGKTYPFLITKLEKNARNLVVSRRILLEREQAESFAQVLATLKPGDTVEATISRLAPFGAFVELAPGLEGMVHVSELSWSRVQQPDEAVSAGDKVRAKILSIQEGEKGKSPRISLSIQQAGGDPWETVSERLAVDQIVTGKVTRLAQFGAFVEILPGVEGLAHLSELSWTRRVNKAEEVVAPGDTVSAKIKEIDLERRRISLSLKEAEGDPWEDVESRFAVGSTVAGTVEKRAQFGLFVNLAPGVTALLPTALANASAEAKQYGKLGTGDSVTLIVRAVDTAARRITLAPADAAEAEGESEWRKYAKPEGKKADSPVKGAKVAEPTASGFGALGLALQAAALKKSVKK